jgi:hypothetical protein
MFIIGIKELSANKWDGYAINTNTKGIKIVIDNSLYNTEEWGFTTGDVDLDSFIGASIISFSWGHNTSIDLANVLPPVIDDMHNNIAIVNVTTTKGTFQVVFWNNQDGTNSHIVKVVVDGDIFLECTI